MPRSRITQAGVVRLAAVVIHAVDTSPSIRLAAARCGLSSLEAESTVAVTFTDAFDRRAVSSCTVAGGVWSAPLAGTPLTMFETPPAAPPPSRARTAK